MCNCDGMMYVCDACHDGDIIAEQRARIAELEARLAEPLASRVSASMPVAPAPVPLWKRLLLRAAREVAR